MGEIDAVGVPRSALLNPPVGPAAGQPPAAMEPPAEHCEQPLEPPAEHREQPPAPLERTMVGQHVIKGRQLPETLAHALGRSDALAVAGAGASAALTCSAIGLRAAAVSTGRARAACCPAASSKKSGEIRGF